MRPGRWLLGTAVALGLLLVGADALVRQLSFERLRPLLEERLSRTLGLDVVVAGRIQLELLPSPQFQVETLTVANLPDRPSAHLLEIGRLWLDLEVLPLLRRVVSVEAIEISDAELRLELDTEGRLALVPEVDAPREPAGQPTGSSPFQIRHLSVEDLRIFYDRAGEESATSLVLDRLELEADDFASPVHLGGAGRYAGGSFEFGGETGSVDELLQPSAPFPVDLRVRVDQNELELELEGTLEAPLRGAGLDLAFAARLRDASFLFPETVGAVSDLGPLSLAGSLEDPEGTLGVTALRIESTTGGPIRLQVDGSVRDLVGFEGVELDVEADAENLGVFEELVDMPLPEGPVNAVFRVSDAGGSLGVTGEAHAGADEGPYVLDAVGTVGDLSGLAGLDVRVQLRSERLATLPDALELDLGTSVPELGPLEGRGRLLDDGTGVIGLHDLEAFAGDRDRRGSWALVTGSIRDVAGRRGVELATRFGAQEARELARLFDRDLPALGRLRGEAAISDRDGSLGIESSSLSVGRPGVFALDLRGGLDDLREIDEIAFELDFSAHDLAVVGALFDAELVAIGPVEVKARARGSDEKIVSQGHAILGGTRLDGEWEASFAPGERRRFAAVLESSHVRLADIGLAPDVERPDRRSDDPSLFRRWWSAAEALPVELLRDFDLDLDLRAQRVTGQGGLELEGVHAGLELEDGLLTLRDVAARYEGGKLDGSLSLDARPEAPHWALQLEAYNVDLTQAADQFTTDDAFAGYLDLSLDLTSRGATRAVLTSALDGRFGAMLREGTLLSGYARAFFLDFLRISVPEFLSLLEQESAPPIQCMLAVAPISDGVARMEQLYLEGSQITIVATGSIDLPRNQFDLRLAPRVHDPGLVSVAATVDVSGPIEAPVFTPLPRSLAASAARALFENAMRPVRGALQYSLGREPIPGDDPCAVVLIQRERDRHPEAGGAG